MVENLRDLAVLPQKWAKVDRLTRLFYLESCRLSLQRLAAYWMNEEAALRGHSPTSDAGAESWLLSLVPVARTLRYLEHGLQSGGRPWVPSVRHRIDGRSIARIFPFGFHEALTFWGYRGQVWSVGSDFQGQEFSKAREESRGPALVLGASNVSSICLTDALCKLFCENRPVVCLIPRRLAPLAPVFGEIFHPLVRDHHLQFVVGGAEEGQALLAHPMFETVHLTGAKETFDTIVSQNSFPDRTFTAELGCVTPLVITPGNWTFDEIRYQARHLASLLVMNGGYNCVTPQVIVMAANWPHKEQFLDSLRTELARVSRRDDLFPGAAEKRAEWRKLYPKGEAFGPRTLVRLEAEADEPMFAREAFCGMLGWVELQTSNLEEFFRESVDFCNNRLWGDLSCNLWVDNLTHRDKEVALAHALTELRYGTVGVNVYTGVGFATAVLPWGSYRGGQSDTGSGWVHNAFFFDRPEKSVLEGSFIPSFVPPWYKPFPRLNEVGRALFELELNPSHKNLAKLGAAYGLALWTRRGRRYR